MNDPPSRSSAAGVLGQDLYKGKPDWDGDSNIARNPCRKEGRIEHSWNEDVLAIAACYKANGECIKPQRRS